VKLDASGNLTWQKCLGSNDDDEAHVIKQTTDGGYIVGGYVSAGDGDVSANNGQEDGWLVKLDTSGTIEWETNLGGSHNERINDLFELDNGNFLFCALTESVDGDVSGNHGAAGWSDFWIGEVTSAGALQWQKCLGGAGDDMLYNAASLADGGYLLVGSTDSSDGDVSGGHGSKDIWVVKVDSSGALLWQVCLGGSLDDEGWQVQPTADSGCLVSGYSASDNGNVSGSHGCGDYWVVKLQSDTSMEWQRCYGGTLGDSGRSIILTSDGGYAVLGESNSHDGDVSGSHGLEEFWAIKRPAVTAP
ncbi:MAG: hypothetical protein JW782_00230, partial [Candidatus Saganbacteria bacterium]|nr:hypothetical protein [Candidatus Saganbacteria bacterium]